MTALVDTSVLAGASGDLDAVDEPWAISVVSVGELEASVLRSNDRRARAQRLARLTAIVSEAPVLPIDRQIAGVYSYLRAHAGRRPHNDLWIAATAIAHQLVLVSADERQAALLGVNARLVKSSSR